MSGLDVLASNLYAVTDTSANGWDRLPEDVQELWRDQARVIAGHMAEADGGIQPSHVDGPRFLPDVPLDDAVEVAVAAADAVNTAAVGSAVADLDAEQAIRLLAHLRDAVDTLRAIDNTLERHIYLVAEHGKQVVDGIGEVMVSRARDRRKWDERGVARAVVDAHMAEGTAEFPDPWDVAEWLLEVYGVSYCRVTPLRAMGIEPAAFCEDTPGRVQVQLP